MKGKHLVHAILVGCIVTLAGCAIGAQVPAAPMPSPTLSPTATSTPQILTFLQNPSIPPNANGWSNQAGCGDVRVDGLHLASGNICLAPSIVSAFSDGTVSVDVRQVSGVITHGYTLIFRAGGSRQVPDFYGFLIVSQGYWRAYRLSGGSATFFAPFTASSAIHTGLNKTNNLKVVMRGSHFELFVNGTKVGQFDDSTLTSGVPGFFGNVGSEVVFSNFVMRVA